MFRGNGRRIPEKKILKKWHPEAISLDSLPVGSPARVVTLEGGQVFRERVSSMGLRPGARVEVLRRGRATPLLVAAGSARLALGHGMSERVLVEEIKETNQVTEDSSKE